MHSIRKMQFGFWLMAFCASGYSQEPFQIVKVQGSLAIINRGAEMGIKAGQTLTVARKSGSGYINICTVTVVKVLPDRAAVRLGQSFGQNFMQVGDVILQPDNDVDQLLLESNRTADTNWTILFGIKGGIITPGTVYLNDNFEIDTDLSYSVGGFLDYRLAPKLTGGLAIDFNNISLFEVSNTLLDMGFTLKALVGSNTGRITFKPGIGFGFGLGISSDLEDVEGSKYFTGRAITEVAIALRGKTSLLIEGNLYFSPAGGNDEYDITFGPMFLIRGGFAF